MTVACPIDAEGQEALLKAASITTRLPGWTITWGDWRDSMIRASRYCYPAELDDSPRMKRFTLASGLYDTADTLVGAIEWLNGLLAQVPAEYRDSVKFDLYPGGYEDGATLEIWYERPMTAEEIAEEDERNRASMERFKAQREADERAQFERLRAKFGKA